MPSSFQAMHDETRSLSLLEPHERHDANEGRHPLPGGLTLLSFVLVVLVPLVAAFAL